MKAKELKHASIDELEARADRCFDLAPSPADEPPRFLDSGDKIQLLLEAQFYLTTVARKHDDHIARRDLWLELAVIVLIFGEILLSIYGIRAGIREAKEQASVLSNIDRSTKDSADAMSQAKSSLAGLTDSQSSRLLKKSDIL